MKSIILSASDPGGANAVLPLVQPLSKKFDLHIILGGVGKGIFKKSGVKFIDGDRLGKMELGRLIAKFHPDLFLAGSSFGHTVDKRILGLLKGKAKTIYILDFWSNYWQRFSSNRIKDFKYLPDLICVMDDLAKREMIKEGFDSKILKVTGNPYFDSFSKKVGSRLEEKNRILFVSQPYSSGEKEVATNFGYNELSSLADIMAVLKSFGSYKLVIRPHPKDNPKKFYKIIKENKNFSLDNDADAGLSIAKADIIVGMNSTMLLQAALAGKKVISYQPELTKSKDILISNKMGLSKLITDKVELKGVMGNYFNGKNVNMVGKGRLEKFRLPRDATNKVLKLIKS